MGSRFDAERGQSSELQHTQLRNGGEAENETKRFVGGNVGIAIIPVGAMKRSGLRRVPLKQLNLVRSVSAYTVAGRHRAIGCSTLLNRLRATDWAFDSGELH